MREDDEDEDEDSYNKRGRDSPNNSGLVGALSGDVAVTASIGGGAGLSSNYKSDLNFEIGVPSNNRNFLKGNRQTHEESSLGSNMRSSRKAKDKQKRDKMKRLSTFNQSGEKSKDSERDTGSI